MHRFYLTNDARCDCRWIHSAKDTTHSYDEGEAWRCALRLWIWIQWKLKTFRIVCTIYIHESVSRLSLRVNKIQSSCEWQMTMDSMWFCQWNIHDAREQTLIPNKYTACYIHSDSPLRFSTNSTLAPHYEIRATMVSATLKLKIHAIRLGLIRFGWVYLCG